MQTDFGIGGGGAMRGVCKKVDPELEIYDLNHTIEKFNVRRASVTLYNVVPYWPAGTVFVSVIDPGVGTSRRASVAKLKNGSYVVSPDNGSLTLLLEEPGIEAIRVIDETKNRLKGTEKVSIFHGRDLFAYCAAKLAAGVIDFEGVGAAYPVGEIVRFPVLKNTVAPGKVDGYAADEMKPFGNLESSIRIADFEQAGIPVNTDVHVRICGEGKTVYDRTIPYKPSFGWVPKGGEVMYNSSDGYIGIGVNCGNFVSRNGIGFGEKWTMTVEGGAK